MKLLLEVRDAAWFASLPRPLRPLSDESVWMAFESREVPSAPLPWVFVAWLFAALFTLPLPPALVALGLAALAALAALELAFALPALPFLPLVPRARAREKNVAAQTSFTDTILPEGTTDVEQGGANERPTATATKDVRRNVKSDARST